ncbi:hypothetical protein L227DRAFT_244253 [Lentinus tigrinus ALCF2SS1-6]|uniref:Uncharacterized protein n=1 Tax=Lentinus tigrinus ALCF2SS1-6 TaxID=1328759 RepID=A0A5C2S0F8_9APHY|nr:hypothetical protein L227DRAFT_244253 [Lentinus tigrinus ALCF2SS1-6]
MDFSKPPYFRMYMQRTRLEGPRAVVVLRGSMVQSSPPLPLHPWSRKPLRLFSSLSSMFGARPGSHLGCPCVNRVQTPVRLAGQWRCSISSCVRRGPRSCRYISIAATPAIHPPGALASSVSPPKNKLPVDCIYYRARCHLGYTRRQRRLFHPSLRPPIILPVPT